MAGVFDETPEEDVEDQAPGIRVAAALTGDGESAPEEEQTPQAEQPQGTVDGSGQSYLTPAGADDGESGPPQASEADVPVSADTKAYMQPVAPPTLAKPAAFADHSADTAAMTAQKAAEAAENVKPSIGRKILAALSAGAAGFGSRNSEVGARIGQEIMNGPRTDAEARWATQEAPIQAKLNADQAADAATTRANQTTEQSNRLAETNYSNQIRGQQDAARADNYNAQAQAKRDAITAFTPDDPANPYAGGTGTTADGRTQKGIPPPDSWIQRWVKTPDGQLAAQQMTLKQRGVAAEQIGLKGQDRQDFLANGKISQRVPRQPSAEEISLGQARAAFIRENGRAPQTLDEQNRVTQAAKGNLDRTPAGATGPGEVIAKNMQDKQAYLDSLTKLPDGTYTDEHGTATISQKEVNDRIEKFRTDLNANPVMRKSGTMVDPQGNTVNNRFSRNPTAAATAAPQQASVAPPAPVYKAKSGGTVTVGTHVVVAGKPGIVTGFDGNGKPIVK